MNKTKMGYESPSIMTLVVRVGGCLCGSPLVNATNKTEYFVFDDDYTEL